MKKAAILLTIFPGSLFMLAFVSYILCSIAERDLPKGGANIGLGILFLTASVNIPTILIWLYILMKKKS